VLLLKAPGNSVIHGFVGVLISLVILENESLQPSQIRIGALLHLAGPRLLLFTLSEEMRKYNMINHCYHYGIAVHVQTT
jgi:hypothetical protein